MSERLELGSSVARAWPRLARVRGGPPGFDLLNHPDLWGAVRGLLRPDGAQRLPFAPA